MRFPDMLRELIKLSGRTQKEVSSALLYSPGEVSKILSGQRIPVEENARQIIERSAAYFGAILWQNGIGAAFEALFPLHPPMASQQDVSSFLGHALWASYGQQIQMAQGGGGGRLLVGREDIDRALWASLADLSRETAGPNEVWLTLDLFLSLLERTGLPVGPGSRLSFRVLMSLDAGYPALSRKRLELLMRGMYPDAPRRMVSFHFAPASGASAFAYAEGRFALQVMPGVVTMPVGVLMRLPRYLMEFGLTISRLYRRPASGTGQEIHQRILKEWDRLDAALQGCEAIYSFDNIGFFASAGHMARFDAEPEVKDRIAHLLERLMHSDIPMLVTVDATDRFSQTQNTWVPVLGRLPLIGKDAVTYMSAYNDIVNAKHHIRLHVTSSAFARGAVLVLAKYYLIFLPPQDNGQDWFLVLPRALCQGLDEEMAQLLREESLPVDEALWGTYFRQLLEHASNPQPHDN